MSLLYLAKSITKEAYSGSTILLWVMNQIDMKKFGERVLQAQICPEIETKCVLLEYNYTSWSDVKAGLSDVSDRLPGTDLLVHNALSSPEFWRLANEYITGNDARATMYCRRKTDYETNKAHPYRMQLMLVFAKELPVPREDVSEISSNY